VQVALHWDAPDAEHVVRGKHLGAIQINLRGCVEAVEDKVNVRSGQQRGRYVEVEPVLPALIFNPLQLGLVVPKERVGDFLVGEEIQVDVTRDGGREPAVFIRLRGGCNLTELPAVIQRQDGILRGFRLRMHHSGSDANRRRGQGAANNAPSNCFSHCTPSKTFHNAVFTAGIGESRIR